MHPLLLPWFAEVGIISVRDLSEKHRPPLPSEFLASFVVFGFLGLFARAAPRASALTGWGLVLATLLSSSVDILGPVGDLLSGKTGAKGGRDPGTATLPPGNLGKIGA